MAPRSSHRQLEQNTNETSTQPNPTASNDDLNDKLFLDPMLGTPLAIYIEKDVEDRSLLADIITVSRVKKSCHVGRMAVVYSSCLEGSRCFAIERNDGSITDRCHQRHGGIFSQGYSGVPYILGAYNCSTVSPISLQFHLRWIARSPRDPCRVLRPASCY